MRSVVSARSSRLAILVADPTVVVAVLVASLVAASRGVAVVDRFAVAVLPRRLKCL